MKLEIFGFSQDKQMGIQFCITDFHEIFTFLAFVERSFNDSNQM